MIRCRTVVLFLLFVFVLTACSRKQEGIVEGTIVPPGTAADISAVRDGGAAPAVALNVRDGIFRSALPAGTYTLTVRTPGAPYPLTLRNIVVKAGDTTVVPLVELKPLAAGTACLSGRIVPSCPGAEVKLMHEGQERAAVRVGPEGTYEFKELPGGTYEIQASAPGHAGDSSQVSINENQTQRRNAVLLPISSIGGVDWTSGKIQATGIGMPPPDLTNGTIRREMAKRAALLDAERNMLRTIEMIRVDDDHTVKTVMGDKRAALRIQGFLKGFSVISEKELQNGKMEVTIELPLTGPSGLSRYIAE